MAKPIDKLNLKIPSARRAAIAASIAYDRSGLTKNPDLEEV
ncbi:MULTISPECIES: hypothetical protein [unclassified Paraburkholderia]|nr:MULTISPECIES: hypothetical protein [unclassified Paraburkholderia]